MKKTVLITGASRGIGRAIAVAFAKAGYNLVITCSKSETELLHLKNDLERDYSVDVLASIGDISDFEYVTQLFSHIEQRFHGVDVLVNNAGISYVGLLTDMTIDEWNHILGVNLTSVFSTCKLAIPHMLSRKSGKIINISSVWGNVGASCEVAYSACKGGMNSFTRGLAKELAPSNIQVNAYEIRSAWRSAQSPPPGRQGPPQKTGRHECRLPPPGPIWPGRCRKCRTDAPRHSSDSG